MLVADRAVQDGGEGILHALVAIALSRHRLDAVRRLKLLERSVRWT